MPTVLLTIAFPVHGTNKISVAYNHIVEEIAYSIHNMVVEKRNTRLKEQLNIVDFILSIGMVLFFLSYAFLSRGKVQKYRNLFCKKVQKYANLR